MLFTGLPVRRKVLAKANTTEQATHKLKVDTPPPGSDTKILILGPK